MGSEIDELFFPSATEDEGICQTTNTAANFDGTTT